MDERGNRDEMVVATKYCGPWQQHEGTSHKLQSNFGGGNSKNLHLSVEASLKKLRTSYIDLVGFGENSFSLSLSLPFITKPAKKKEKEIGKVYRQKKNSSTSTSGT